MDILLLTTAAQHKTENKDVILEPKALKKWLSNLEKNNIQTTVSVLYTSIDNFNELRIEDKVRIKLLNIYYEALQEILMTFDELRINMLPIQHHEKQKLREDVMWLYLSLANGYKLIIKNAYSSNISPKKNVHIRDSVYIAMELLFDGLLYAYRAHLSPPQLARLEINQLYYYSVNNAIADISIKSAKGHDINPSISILYKQHILMSIIDPYQLSSNDILELYLFLETIANNCEIEFLTDKSNLDGKYIVDLMNDCGPVASELIDNIQETQHLISIDAFPIVNALAGKLSVHDTENHSFSELQEKHYIDIIIKNLMNGTERNSLRRNINIKSKIFIGIEDFVSFANNPKEVNLSAWTIINIGETGFALLAEQETSTEITIGDLMFVMPEKNSSFDTSFIISIIRWVRLNEDNKLQVGVEILHGKAVPVHYETESDLGLDIDGESEQIGIFFSRNEHIKEHSLLINRKFYNKDKKIHVSRNGKNMELSSVALLVNSPFYILLQVKHSA